MEGGGGSVHQKMQYAVSIMEEIKNQSFILLQIYFNKVQIKKLEVGRYLLVTALAHIAQNEIWDC